MKKILISSLFLLFALCSVTLAEEIIPGPDGVLYRKEGNTIVSSKGIVYQISGDKMFGSDGTICINRNGFVKCRNINDDDDDRDRYRRDDRYERDRYYRDRYYDRDYDWDYYRRDYRR